MKILVERLDVHGDVLVGTSALPGLHTKYPDAHIHWHVRRGFGTLLEHNPYLYTILQGPILPLDKKVFDLCFSLDHHYCWSKPMAAIYCEICDVPLHRPEIYLTTEELAIQEKLKGRILVANKAGWRSRECPALSQVLAEIAPKHPDLLQVDLGAPIPGIEQFPGNLRQVAALMKYARLYIGVDTVFMHMAVALETPMVLFLGPTGPETQYIPGAIFTRPFVHLNPAEPNIAFANGIQLSQSEILNTIRRRLSDSGDIIMEEQ